MSHAEIWQKNEKQGMVKAQLCSWGSLPCVFQEGRRPAWLSQEGERRWEVVGPGGKRKGRSQSEKELMEPVAAGFRS